MNTATEIPQKTAIQWFYEQIRELKAKLPTKYKTQLLKFLPDEYNSFEGSRILNDVMNCRTTDMNILEAIKTLIGDAK